MKTILFTIVLCILSNLSIAQSTIGYEYNYEIRFDVSQFDEEEPRNTIRNFVNHIFDTQKETFNIQTRYSADGVIYISSDRQIDESAVKDYFHAEKSSVLSFERIPQRTNSIVSNNTFAQIKVYLN